MSKNIVLLTFLFFMIPFWGYAFDNKQTHPLLTEKAVENATILDDMLKTQLGFAEGVREKLRNGEITPQAITEWFKTGSKEEDEPACRAANHFHDPLKDWSQSKLTDTVWIVDRWCDATSPFREKYSNISWATGYSDAKGSTMPATVNGLSASADANGRNWFVARDWYYRALVEINPQEREKRFAETFRTLGYVLHLLEDMAVPAHTRNDFSQGHSQVIGCPAQGECDFWGLDWIGNPFEGYVRDHYDKEILPLIVADISKPFTGEKKLTNYWDTDTVNGNVSPPDGTNIGLAEYTNGNFFSQYTMFAPEYPYPAKGVDTEKKSLPIPDPFHPGTEVKREYWMKKATATTDSYRLTGVDFSTFVLEPLYIDGIEKVETLPPMDKYVFLDYAKLLVPRAIGYSADLIDYFFRGRLDIQVDGLKYAEDSSITEANIRVRNQTPSQLPGQAIEPIENGALDLAYGFIPANGSTKEYRLVKGVYTISNAGDLINSEYVPITAPLNIPAGARDITFTVVFRGKLGGEPDAVAAKVYNFNNSRIAYFYQPNGQPNTSNIFTISPDGSNPYQVTNASVTNPWYFSPTWSKDGTMIAFEKERCDDPNPNPADPSCSLQYYHRDIIGINLLSALKYPDNIQFVRNYSGDSVANATFSPDGTKIAALKLNESGLWFSNLVVFDLVNNSQWIVNKDDDPDLTSLDWSAPAWSPTGDKIAYYLYRQYDEASRTMAFARDLFLIDPYTGAKTRLTNDEFNNMEPSWSPDGEKIAFSSDRDGEASMDIWVMDKNGENLRKLFDCTPASCYSPTFSPDGQQVAFSNGSSIYSVGINGDPYSAKELSQIGDYIGGLSWSPFLVPPTFLDIQANPDIISGGGTAVLSWQSDRATEVDIQGIAEKQPASGTIAVSPATTTTYALTASGPTGSSKTTITVKVE